MHIQVFHCHGKVGENVSGEVKYAINITKSIKKICLSLHYNGSNSFLYANKVYQSCEKSCKNSINF